MNRIDVHQHIVPPFYAQAMPAHGGDPSGSRTPDWTARRAIDFMDAHAITAAVLSVSTPGVAGWDGEDRRAMARRINEYTAKVVADRPDRFGNFATLPLPDLDGALAELDHALDSLDADGVVLLADYEGRYLGDPVFQTLWAELDRRAAVVFIHPGATPHQPVLPGVDGLAGPLVDFPFETTRTAVQLVLNGTLDRYPNVRVILSHAGGFVPYAAERFAGLARVFRPEAPDPDHVLAAFKRFYFDTALSSGTAIPSLKSFAGADRILFGTDFPYAREDIAGFFTDTLDADDTLTMSERSAVAGENAARLFPRWAAS
ncbi:amidohydrolase family protein [Catenulispora sp. NF23]|uniref:6-methylsalicylate decarboxylase n=1 Tax=Catenulispora pinistramenti TaxID=2705254 RepID=A0ABS5KQI1_9ACTN|nr:amidohydrolase family protein [Catenulispora pinistramenti]MBS2531737.1 amidohydrolase family protein [Catenulispora pinistramenti]MBS2548302.1 amidohydrolase family protein [Catenulispora pinistramenti]